MVSFAPRLPYQQERAPSVYVDRPAIRSSIPDIGKTLSSPPRLVSPSLLTNEQRPLCETDQSPFSRTEVKIVQIYNYTLHTPSYYVSQLNTGKALPFCWTYDMRFMIYLLTAIGLSPGGSSTVHIYTQTIHRTTQNKQYIEKHNNLGKCGPCPVLASYTMAFALQLRKKHGKTSVRVAASKNT